MSELLEFNQLFLGGEWTDPASTKKIEVFSPFSEQQVGVVPAAVETDVNRAVAAAKSAFEDPAGWAAWPVAQRIEAIERFAVALERRGPEIARMVTLQNGMPINLSTKWEAAQPAKLLRYYSEIGPDWMEEVRPGRNGMQQLVTRDPIGVVGLIVPWNAPQSLTFLKMAPALVAGCTVVLKPAPETVLDAFVVAHAAAEADLPPGVINIIPGGREVGAQLVEHPDVHKIAFTGSSQAGRSIAASCGQLLRPVTLELGGKSAALVLDDADLSSDPGAFLHSTMANNGQVCWLATRVLVPKHRHTELLEEITEMVSQLRIGDPMDSETQVGPLVAARQRDRVESYIAKGLDEGGRITVGGGRPSEFSKGFFVQPTVFSGLSQDSTVVREEIFGPVITVQTYESEAEMLSMANDSPYGLGGSVWTSDPERGEAIARQVQTGTISVNRFMNDYHAPFGGIRASGIGREMGPEGLMSYQNMKTVHLNKPNTSS